eukprot:765934-Hanusia_phi.AAC.1
MEGPLHGSENRRKEEEGEEERGEGQDGRGQDRAEEGIKERRGGDKSSRNPYDGKSLGWRRSGQARVRVKWWGESGYGSLLRPASCPAGGGAALASSVFYSIRCCRANLVEYLRDARQIKLDIVDESNHMIIANAVIEFQSCLASLAKPQNSWSRNGEEFEELSTPPRTETIWDDNVAIYTPDGHQVQLSRSVRVNRKIGEMKVVLDMRFKSSPQRTSEQQKLLSGLPLTLCQILEGSKESAQGHYTNLSKSPNGHQQASFSLSNNTAERSQANQTFSSSRRVRQEVYGDESQLSLNKTYPSHPPPQRGETAGGGERGKEQDRGVVDGGRERKKGGGGGGGGGGRGGGGGGGGSSIMHTSKQLLEDGDQAMSTLMRMIDDGDDGADGDDDGNFNNNDGVGVVGVKDPKLMREEEVRDERIKSDYKDFHNISSILEVSSQGNFNEYLSFRQQEEQQSEGSFTGKDDMRRRDEKNNNSCDDSYNSKNDNSSSRSRNKNNYISSSNTQAQDIQKLAGEGKFVEDETNSCMRSVELLEKLLMKGKSLIGKMDEITQRKSENSTGVPQCNEDVQVKLMKFLSRI